MSRLSKLSDEFININTWDLTTGQLKRLRDELQRIPAEDIHTQSDSMSFLTLLSHFRQAVANNDTLNGDNYAEFLSSILSVGEDGVYSDPLRFIFELIQNVDDCDYRDPEDCDLEMRFAYGETPAGIVLTYNEVGFTPYNVFAITGIAEAAKNVRAGKTEIGEKGIGFKSVFGVADRVLIQSGLFSFALNKKNFTSPVPEYDNYEEVNGTRMTLFMSREKTQEIYRALVKRYCSKDAVFNRNPLLFLNKLTRLKMYFDDFRSLEFSVSRKQRDEQEFHVEEDVIVRADVRDALNGREQNISSEIRCIRFTMPVTYDRDACRSRYGANTRVGDPSGKLMQIQAVVPVPEQVEEVQYGTLYSFLPTQIRLNIPAAIHVPYKLDASREFVDPQGENAWFARSCESLSELLGEMFPALSRIVRERLVFYLPGETASVFSRTNEKVNCLIHNASLRALRLNMLPLFVATDGSWNALREIICLNPDEVKDPAVVYPLLNESRPLFLAPAGAPLKKIGMEVLSNINDRIYLQAFASEEVTAPALKYLSMQEKWSLQDGDVDRVATRNLTVNQILQIEQYERFQTPFAANACNRIKRGAVPSFIISGTQMVDFRQLICDDFELEDIPVLVRNYLKRIEYQCVLAEASGSFSFAAGNALLLPKMSVMKSFADFCSRIDKNDLFASNLRIRNASKELDLLDNTDISAPEYLKKLKGVRSSVKSALGPQAYKNYIDLILQSGNRKDRFIQELLQNADDCEYPESEDPSFSMTFEKDRIQVDYNEVGFRKANVRAITAIGDSTKKRLLDESRSGVRQSIGEKGVGFKTVFGAASEVTTHSGEFHFKLTDKAPTIPQMIEAGEPTKGTRMIFLLKKEMSSQLSEKEILKLCLCLHNLKNIRIENHTVEIEDTDTERRVRINGTLHQFLYLDYAFDVDDEAALSERSEGGRVIDPAQYISCYLSEGKTEESADYWLYNGLPTTVSSKIRVNIDAPYMLDTARDRVQHGSSWNNIVTQNVYHALSALLLQSRELLRGSALSYIALENRQTNRGIKAVGCVFSDETLCGDAWISELRQTEFLPTFEKDIYVKASDNCRRYPPVVNYLIRSGAAISVSASRVLDVSRDYDSVLNAMGCRMESFENSLNEVKPHIGRFITEEKFRGLLYSWLRNAVIMDRNLLRGLMIIPVYKISGTGTEYIAWAADRIFTKQGARNSTDAYYVLNEQILKREECEAIFGVHINEMDERYEAAKYQEEFRTQLEELTLKPLQQYNYLLREFQSGRMARYNCIDVARSWYSKHKIYLRSNAATITNRELFINRTEEGYFNSSIVDAITVHPKCERLAEALGCKDLSGIHYNDIRKPQPLTEDDLEAFQDDYFLNGWEILRGYAEQGYISEKLIEDYHLEALFGRSNVRQEEFPFPTENVKNMDLLRRQIAGRWVNPGRIESRPVTRIEKYVNFNGQISSINAAEIRRQAMERYSPKTGYCFCQMCRKVKAERHIEVNNLEKNPQYYWPELRISLCLECSKTFEAARASAFYDRFFDKLKSASLGSGDNIEIPLGDLETITFTQTHLAMIQEILSKMPEQKIKTRN